MLRKQAFRCRGASIFNLSSKDVVWKYGRRFGCQDPRKVYQNLSISQLFGGEFSRFGRLKSQVGVKLRRSVRGALSKLWKLLETAGNGRGSAQT